MWLKIATWARKNWLWIIGTLTLIVVGILSGWRLAALLGVGAATGGAAKSLGENQKRREAEARELEQRYQDLAGEAKKTDQMYEDYKRRRNQR